MNDTRKNEMEKGWGGYSARGLQWRLFLTCWLVYFLHFSPFVSRELYLTISLAERHTVHVDDYIGMHPDLFVLEGRGSFMGGNPGASILAAIPYALALPVVDKLAPYRIPGADEKIKAETKDPRFMRQMFFKKARSLGIDVRLGLSAMITAGFFMAPLAALSAVLMFRAFRWIGVQPKGALWLAFLFAFGTPIFFRAGTLSLNLVVALFAFFAFLLLWWPSGTHPERERWRLVGAGFLAGFGVLTDYSGAVPAAALGIFAFAQQWRSKPLWPALRESLWYLVGAAPPVLFLLWWQWYCYGNPWLPAQYHMPKKFYQHYQSERGFGRPLPEALFGLLFDPLYGLVIFSPIFTVALYHFALLRKGTNRVPLRVVVFTWTFSLAFWVFCSMIHYTLRHQWQEGVRYMVPVVPFLFLLVGDVLTRIPRAVAYLIGLVAVVEMWCIAMVRENPLDSMLRIFFLGFELPSLTTLSRVAANYYPALESGGSPIALLVLCGVVIWALWRVREPWAVLEEDL
jgi:hypothetical protein